MERETECHESSASLVVQTSYFLLSLVRDRTRLLWGDNKQVRSACLENDDNFDFGAYKWTVQLVTNESRLEKILFPIFWGLMTLRYPFFFNLILIRNWFLKMFFRVLSEQIFRVKFRLPKVIVSCCCESDKVWIMKTVLLGIWRARRIA